MEASLGKTVVTVALASAVAWQVRLCSFGGAADLAAENRRLRAALAKAGVAAEAGGGEGRRTSGSGPSWLPFAPRPARD